MFFLFMENPVFDQFWDFANSFKTGGIRISQKMKTRFVWAIPYGIQGLKIMKIKYVTKNWHYSACIGFNTWKNVSFGKNEKSEASFYWDSPYVCVWREALELECLTFYCLTGRWMFYHCSLEWSAPFLIFRQCVIHLWWAMLRLIYRIQYAANRRRQ